jgi:hypothetical protein
MVGSDLSDLVGQRHIFSPIADRVRAAAQQRERTMGIKAPWDWCPGTRVDANGNKCELIDTRIDLFLLVYIKYTCIYQCPGPAGVKIQEGHTRKRVLLIFDSED